MVKIKILGTYYVWILCISIWEEKVYFWNIPSGAAIYSYNKINPLLLIAFCLQFYVDHCWMSEMGMHVRCENQCVSELRLLECSFCCLNWCSVCKNVTCWTCHLWPLNLLLHNKDQCYISKQFLPYVAMVNTWKSLTTPLDCMVQVFWKNKSIHFATLCCKVLHN